MKKNDFVQTDFDVNDFNEKNLTEFMSALIPKGTCERTEDKKNKLYDMTISHASLPSQISVSMKTTWSNQPMRFAFEENSSYAIRNKPGLNDVLDGNDNLVEFRCSKCKRSIRCMVTNKKEHLSVSSCIFCGSTKDKGTLVQAGYHGITNSGWLLKEALECGTMLYQMFIPKMIILFDYNDIIEAYNRTNSTVYSPDSPDFIKSTINDYGHRGHYNGILRNISLMDMLTGTANIRALIIEYECDVVKEKIGRGGYRRPVDLHTNMRAVKYHVTNSAYKNGSAETHGREHYIDSIMKVIDLSKASEPGIGYFLDRLNNISMNSEAREIIKRLNELDNFGLLSPKVKESLNAGFRNSPVVNDSPLFSSGIKKQNGHGYIDPRDVKKKRKSKGK